MLLYGIVMMSIFFFCLKIFGFIMYVFYEVGLVYDRKFKVE